MRSELVELYTAAWAASEAALDAASEAALDASVKAAARAADFTALAAEAALAAAIYLAPLGELGGGAVIEEWVHGRTLTLEGREAACTEGRECRLRIPPD